MDALTYLRLMELTLSNARRAAEEGTPDALSTPVEVWVDGKTIHVHRCYVMDGKIVISSDSE